MKNFKSTILKTLFILILITILIGMCVIFAACESTPLLSPSYESIVYDHVNKILSWEQSKGAVSYIVKIDSDVEKEVSIKYPIIYVVIFVK